MNRDALEQFTRDLLLTWENRDEGKLSTMYSQDVVGHMDDKVVYYKDIMNRVQFSKNNFKKVSNEVLDLIIEGDKVVARIKQTMIPRVEAKPTVYHITAIYRILNDQVVETWSAFYPNVNYLKND